MQPIFEGLMESPKRRICMLMVTQDCNLNCTYCYEAHKSTRTMSFDLAKTIILKEVGLVQLDTRFEELQIEFMGGEPLMNFDLIRQIVEWLETGPIPVPFICFAATNGILLDEERKDWFRKHRDAIWLGASYDGNTEMQRRNRGNRAKSVDFDFFYEVWPRQGFKLTISKESLPHLAEGVVESQRKGYRMVGSLAQGIDWNDADAELYLAQLRMLAGSYLEDPNLVPINLLSRQLIGFANPSEHQRRFCGSGVYMITYDVDGRTYGCHMFSPIVLGQDNALETSKVDWSCDTIADDPRCKDCCLKDYCPTCMGFNYRYRGDLSKRDYRWCKMVLAEAIASCEFQIKVLTARRESLDEIEAARGQCALAAYPLLSTLSIQQSQAPFKGLCSDSEAMAAT